MNTIDLNCDVGEGLNNEADLMPFISSCNIACGGHAGDENTMRHAVSLAKENGVKIGAHPSYYDTENFGRSEMNLSPKEITELVKNQILLLKNICSELGTKLHHVKPHGALYIQSAQSRVLSDIIVEAIVEVDDRLLLYGLAESETQRASIEKIRFIAEGFADRKYAKKNQLKSRLENGLIINLDEIKIHLDTLLGNGKVITDEGLELLRIQTLCLHGDTPGATRMIEQIAVYIKELGFKIQAP